MEFDLTTFVLEVLNFLVLVWLLKRFFYRPVLAVIEKRQASTAQTIADAKSVQHEAEALKSQYETHLAELDTEYATQKARIDEEISVERKKRFEALAADIATERKRREVLEEKERSELEQMLEGKAIQLGSRFATRLLDRLAGAELNDKLAELAVSELTSLPDDKQEALESVLHDFKSKVKVVSAYALNKSQQRSFTDALSQLAGRSFVPEFSEDITLKSGVSIKVGSWVMMANLRDELNFFTGNLGHES